MSGLSTTDVYGTLNKKIKGVASGFDHAVKTGENTFSIFFIDGSKIDIEIPFNSNGKIGSELKATVDIGSVTSGKTYASGTSFEAILRDILIKEVAPSVTLTLDPSKTLYDTVTETVSSITLKATVTKGTNNPTSVKFYVGSTEINSQTISAAGTFTFTYNPSTPIHTDTTFKAVVSDGKLSGQNTKTIKFVANSYYGTIDDSVTTIDETVIKGLSKKVLKDSKALTYSGITMTYGKVVYAYPVSLGALTSIKDVVNNLVYTTSFTKTTMNVDGILYNVYTQTDSSASNDVQLTFA